ncbi:ABC transporter permease [Synechococcus sp. 1G10]|uniref:ABC transporter permease n=1 Tax=Synechococcus sp. 1G10 TaxID=2025605 RepID=UPI000B9855D6|nr:ABC transporter permease [Synechococcus sp. 1G10]
MIKLRSILSLGKAFELISILANRDFETTYKGSLLGLGWSIAQPVIMLAIYTFVFSVVFQSRWGSLGGNDKTSFAVNLFVGLICFELFSECANESPGLIVSNPNYVTKLRFPLEALGAAKVLTSLYKALISLGVLFLFLIVTGHGIKMTSLFLPLVWLPLICFTLGTSWLLAAAGVYIRDSQQVISLLTTALVFMSGVFYPIDTLPDQWQGLFALNPLVTIINQARAVIIIGKLPDLVTLLVATTASILFMELSFRGFKRASYSFADVL